MTPFTLLVLSIAAARITRLITRDEIFSKARNRIWKKFPPESSMFGYLFTCDWCTSIWVSSLLVGIDIIAHTTAMTISSVFAISAIAVVVTARIFD